MKPANWCVKCFRGQDQPAGENCKNPIWHDAAVAEQPGTCWRCKCDDMDATGCGCCHMVPCEMER